MKFFEYLGMKPSDLANENTTDIRRAAENDVNVFGYDPEKKLAENPIDISTALALCYECVNYEASKQNWVDGRNEFSNKILSQIRTLPEFEDVYQKYRSENSEEVIGFFERLAEEIGRQLHRTNLQTFASFILYILGTKSSVELGESIQYDVRDGYERFWRLPMI